MEVRLVRYPAGVINVRHTYPCAHSMYVLEGTLVTHAGRYGPCCFVWFPESTVMEHGASAMVRSGAEDSELLGGNRRPVASHSEMTRAYSLRLSAVPYLPRSTSRRFPNPSESVTMAGPDCL